MSGLQELALDSLKTAVREMGAEGLWWANDRDSDSSSQNDASMISVFNRVRESAIR